MTLPEPLVDSETAARALGVTARTVRRMVRDGRLTNHGHRRRVLVDLGELLERQQAGTAHQQPVSVQH